MRLWPQHIKGEGHFIALLRKGKGSDGQERQTIRPFKEKIDERIQEFTVFCRQVLSSVPEGKYHFFGDHLYILPQGIQSLNGIKVLRPGWHLGTFYKKRFEPSHALALSLEASDVKNRADYSVDAPEIGQYLRGEALPYRGEKGWTLVTVDGFPIGWGKSSDNLLKNHYPKGLRW